MGGGFENEILLPKDRTVAQMGGAVLYTEQEECLGLEARLPRDGRRNAE